MFNAIMIYRSLKDLELSHFKGRLADMSEFHTSFSFRFSFSQGTDFGFSFPMSSLGFRDHVWRDHCEPILLAFSFVNGETE